MALIGLISDTHDNQDAVDKASKVFITKNVELILHAGDWIAPFTLMRLAKAGIPIIGVFGNNDGERKFMREVAAKNNVRLEEEIAVVEGYGLKIALIHGTSNIIVEALARSNMFDIVVYGHTHRRDLRRLGKTLLVNPGEACGYLTGEASIAILDTKTKSIEFIFLNA